MVSIFRSLCFSSQLKKILSFYFNICLLSDSCLTWKFKLSHKTHHKLVFQPFFYDYSLRHSSSMIKTLVSLYNLTVSFFLQKTAAIIVVIYIFHMCVFFFLPVSPSSDFSGRLKLLYYSPGVCQIPQQLQTHHPSLALCLRGNKVSGFPGWRICVIVLCLGQGNKSVDTWREMRRKGVRTRGNGRRWWISLSF